MNKKCEKIKPGKEVCVILIWRQILYLDVQCIHYLTTFAGTNKNKGCREKCVVEK